MMPVRPLPIAVLISGSGRTLHNFLMRRAQGRLDIDVRVVISSHAGAGGLKYAEEAGSPARIVPPSQYATPEQFSEAIFGPCREAGVDYVVMAGFIKHVLIPPDFENRVLNIHPGLIPAFCGRGFYGHHVHEAVLQYGAKMSGCTIHFVDNEYDHGPIILQRMVPVLDDDTPETLAARVFEAESEAYPEVLQLLAEGRVQVEGRRVRVLPPS
jgi:phosphoribosylglycinamide formyltransferase-1